MADFTMKAHDLLPTLSATLGYADGSTPDLVGATVRFIMRKQGAAGPKVNAPATIVDPATGSVRYDWTAPDVDTVGEYLAEFEVHRSGDAKPQTFPTASYFSISILADLNEAP